MKQASLSKTKKQPFQLNHAFSKQQLHYCYTASISSYQLSCFHRSQPSRSQDCSERVTQLTQPYPTSFSQLIQHSIYLILFGAIIIISPFPLSNCSSKNSKSSSSHFIFATLLSLSFHLCFFRDSLNAKPTTTTCPVRSQPLHHL